MTIRQLAQLLLTSQDLDKNVKVHYRDSFGYDITSIGFDGHNNFLIGVSGSNEDKLSVRTEIEVKSPYSKESEIF